MTLLNRAFRDDAGFSIQDLVGIIYSTVSPISGSGADAPPGSILLHVPGSGEPKLWKKWGPGAKNWKDLQSKTHIDTTNPGATNDGVDTAAIGVTFEPGDLWVNTTTSTGAYICFLNTTSLAVWHPISASAASSNADTLDWAHLSTDGTFADHSDSLIPSQLATETYISNIDYSYLLTPILTRLSQTEESIADLAIEISYLEQRHSGFTNIFIETFGNKEFDGLIETNSNNPAEILYDNDWNNNWKYTGNT